MTFTFSSIIYNFAMSSCKGIYHRTSYLVLLLLICTRTSAQSDFINYIQTKTFLDDAGATFLRHIDYYDELGVVAESVDVGCNTTGIPMVTKMDYTTQLKPFRQWVPIPASSFEYIEDVDDMATSTFSDDFPFCFNEYDDFAELTSSRKPGNSWEYHNATVVRKVVPAGVVRKYTVNDSGSLCDSGYYPYGVLISSTATDEDGRSLTTYTNVHKETILERHGTDNDTYYVYDKYGRLSYVLPPMCQHCETSSMQKYWYKYTYDDHGRCIEKQLPGCDVVKYWYDDANRIQSEQDGHLRQSALYRNYAYDGLSRPTLQTISSVRGEANEDNAEKVEVKNYYDSYSFRTELAQQFPEWADSINAIYVIPIIVNDGPLATMYSTSENERCFDMYRYDDNGRVTYKLSAYSDQWMKTVHMSYNFVGDIVSTNESVYLYNGQKYFLTGRRTTNTYHPSTRLLANTAVTHIDKYGNETTQIVNNLSYDNWGNVTSNNRPGTAADMTYTYDTLHGWLSGISSPSGFSELIQRENATNAQYSGNIGSTLWRNASNGEQHKYDYEYDNLGRLVSSGYSSSANGSSGRFDETVQYNCQGAITSLQRNGMMNNGTYGTIDDLTINYDGNRLLSVTDDAEALNYSGALDFHDGANMTAEYEYDANGALTRDSNRGISSIVYDYSHNPHMIYFSSGSSMNDYGPDGRKFLSLHTTNASGALSTVSDMYIDGLVLRNGTPHTWQYDGGYITLDANGAATSWNYYVTDHLGSTRKVVTSTNAVKETINYYPYGSEMTMTSPSQLSTNPDWQPFRFSGKELDKVHGLNMYDFGARLFDVAGVPVWTSVDPLCEKYYSVSPYVYCKGNPVGIVDPDGRIIDTSLLDSHEYDIYNENIHALCMSELFKTLYSQLEKSDAVYSILIGEVYGSNGEPVDGQFRANTDTSGGVIFLDRDKTLNGMINPLAITEEFFHAYQNTNINNYTGEFNFEFEAKTFSVASIGQGSQLYKGMESWINDLGTGKYSGRWELISPSSISHGTFLNDYHVAANRYASYNIANNIGNIEYKRTTTCNPVSLINIINRTYR